MASSKPVAPPTARPLEPAAASSCRPTLGQPPVFKRPQHFSCIPPPLDCALPHQHGPGDHTNVMCCWWSPAECFHRPSSRLGWPPEPDAIIWTRCCFLLSPSPDMQPFTFCCFSFSLSTYSKVSYTSVSVSYLTRASLPVADQQGALVLLPPCITPDQNVKSSRVLMLSDWLFPWSRAAEVERPPRLATSTIPLQTRDN